MDDRFASLMAWFEKAAEVPSAQLRAWLDSDVPEDLRVELAELLAEVDDPRFDIREGCFAEPAEMALAAASARSVASTPRVIGGYEVERELGRGGMGTVYLARQSNPERRVAIKVLRDLTSHADLRSRFEQEARVLGRLRHPGIATIFESGVETIAAAEGEFELPYFAMEFVEGTPITDHVVARGLDDRERLELMARVCDAVDHAHGRGVIHRDLKPGNILVADEQPKVLDFGVARLLDGDDGDGGFTQTGQIIGTLSYMSPEQLEGDSAAIDERSDVYALGVLTFEVLTGRLPIDVAGLGIARAAAAARERRALAPSDLDERFAGDVDTIVAKAIDDEKSRRYDSAAALAADIRRFLAHEPIAARPATRSYRLRKFVRRHRGLVVGLAVAFFMLLAGIAATSIFAIRSSRNAGDAVRNLEVAEKQRRLAGRKLYLASLGAAGHGLSVRDWDAVERHLEVAPVGHRDWEWRHMRSRLADRLVEKQQHAQWVRVAWRPDGVPLAVANGDGADRLIRLDTGDTLVRAGIGEQEEYARRAGGFSGDGRRVALWDARRRAFRVFDTADGHAIGAEIPAEGDSKVDVWLDDDGDLLILGRDGRLDGFDVATGASRFVRDDVDGQPILDFLPDGRAFYLAGWDSKRGVRLVSTEDGVVLGNVDAVAGEKIQSLAVDDAGSRLGVLYRGGVVVVDISDGDITHHLGHETPGQCGGVHFAGKDRIVATRPDRMARVWNIASGEVELELAVGSISLTVPYGDFAWAEETGEILVGHRRGAEVASLHPGIVTLRHATYVYDVAFSPDGSMVAAAEFDGRLSLWDADTGIRIGSVETDVRPAASLTFHRDGRAVTVTSRGWDGTDEPGKRGTWNLVSGELTIETIDRETILATALPGSRDRGLAARSRDGKILFGQVAGDGRLQIRRDGRDALDVEDGAVPCTGLAVNDAGTLVAAGGRYEGAVHLWNGRTGRRVALLDPRAGECFALVFSPDGRRLVSCGEAGVSLWDTETFELVWRLSEHTSYVRGVDFSRDGAKIATGSGDGTVKIRDSVPRSTRIRTARAAARRRAAVSALLGERPVDLDGPLPAVDGLTRADLLRVAIEKALSR